MKAGEKQQAAPAHLAKVRGWLDEDDPFFAAMDEIVEARFKHQPRSIMRQSARLPQGRP
jgi:enamine deaminase RidA (YjgF/YER057c/UK114 family)